MTKRNFLSQLAAVVDAVRPPDWERRAADAREAVAAAQREHGSAALAVEQQVPGAAARLTEAIQALQAARARESDLSAARAAFQVQEAERQSKDLAAEAAKQDKAARAAFDAMAAIGREGEAVIAAFAQWWGKAQDAEAACRAQIAANPRIRKDLAQAIRLTYAVPREIARVATTETLPPGADRQAAVSSDRREWPSLGDALAGLADAAFPGSVSQKRTRR